MTDDHESPLPDEDTERDTLTMGLGLDEPGQPATPAAQPGSQASSSGDDGYRVLARKYRPQTFAELIGQDAMIQTLANAIERDRIAHAFLMTGVRGVGKTSTARLIAKSLNCVGADGQGGPTITPCGQCEPCIAITEGRHIDVVEMDAASHTGVDDVREIIEAVRYAAVSARYKIYIIDEVHMLSKNAFNALLKTLEEPPAHVKFIFATTEIDKVPVTVLSRCQRFDLRRIPTELLARHFGKVAEAEGVEVEDEALTVIARAAEGSARDGLSLLDQAIAHGEDKVSADAIRKMLGLADRGRTQRVLDAVIAGDVPGLLGQLDETHSLGIDPAALMRGLMESVHAISRAKAGGVGDILRSEEDRAAASAHAEKLGWPQLHMLWQLMLKGLSDLQVAPDPREALDMALLRLVHAAGMPDPGAVIDALSQGRSVPARALSPGETPGDNGAEAPDARQAAAPQSEEKAALPADFQAFIAALDDAGNHAIAVELHDKVGLVEYAPPKLSLQPRAPLDGNFSRDLATKAKAATGENWEIVLAESGGEPTLREQEQMAEAKAREDILAHPMVKAVTSTFPDAALETVKSKGS
ncbi:DNA polymerase III subunit gamma/tau [Sphingomicrobium lutaoense]|uniref:DNA polymerase III subunit gamma/tau n=1 Tax=Sphingomicrobium lutaoense TaxID=515949 RepID=A0A839Z1Z9_9SPHN|nr:DNA polymerase III subunit gamma/tau [Sphingomicrobium lutaoense]MBB3763763.1 DNA polymerase-3 subunit gamma/tau [Sphingomicrobium lutaoense]